MTRDTGAPTSYAELVEILHALPMLAREKRRREALSLRAAAEQIGIGYSNLNRFEHGADANLTDTVLPILRWVAR